MSQSRQSLWISADQLLGWTSHTFVSPSPQLTPAWLTSLGPVIWPHKYDYYFRCSTITWLPSGHDYRPLIAAITRDLLTPVRDRPASIACHDWVWFDSIQCSAPEDACNRRRTNAHSPLCTAEEIRWPVSIQENIVCASRSKSRDKATRVYKMFCSNLGLKPWECNCSRVKWYVTSLLLNRYCHLCRLISI